MAGCVNLRSGAVVPAVIAVLLAAAGALASFASASALDAAHAPPEAPAAGDAAGIAGAVAVVVGTLMIVLLLRLWRIPDRGPRPIGGGAAGVLALACAALLVQPLGAAIGLWLAGAAVEGTRQPRAQAMAMLGALVVQLPIAAVVLAARRGEGRALGPVRAIALGCGVAIVIMPGVAVTAAAGSALQETLTGRPTDAIAHDTLRSIVADPGPWSRALALLAVVGAPLTEEVLYRGLGHELLRRLGAGSWTMIMVVAAMFALAHWSVVAPPALGGLFVLGLALGWSAERTGTLVAPIAGHAIFNAANVWLATWTP